MTSEAPNMSDHPSMLLSNLSAYFDSSEYSDSTIKCGGQLFKDHKLVLCTQSKFFHKAYSGKWKESKDGVVGLKDDSVEIVKAMLKFLYSGDYEATSGAGTQFSAFFNARVYSIADKYDIPQLKELAEKKFAKIVGSCWDMDDFSDLITEVYNSTPSSDVVLRDRVVDKSCDNIDALRVKDHFKRVMKSVPEFTAELVQKLAVKLTQEPEEQLECSACRFIFPSLEVQDHNGWLACPQCDSLNFAYEY